LVSAVINGTNEFEDMEELGRMREDWFRTFLKLPYGIPGESTFGRIFQWVNPNELMTCMHGWLNFVSKSGNRNINIDGKTIRGGGRYTR
jgi:hypothetical protein